MTSIVFQLVLQRMPLGYSAIAPLLFGAIKVLVCSQRDHKLRPAGLGTAFCPFRPLKPTRLGWNETKSIKHVKWSFLAFLFSYWYLLENSLVRFDTSKHVNTNLTPAFYMKLCLYSMVLVVRNLKGTTKHTLPITFDIIATRQHHVESFSHSCIRKNRYSSQNGRSTVHWRT